MAPSDKSHSLAGGKVTKKADDAPAWADGLKRLYDDVVNEPLPDAFKDLLAELDDSDQDCRASS